MRTQVYETLLPYAIYVLFLIIPSSERERGETPPRERKSTRLKLPNNKGNNVA